MLTKRDLLEMIDALRDEVFSLRYDLSNDHAQIMALIDLVKDSSPKKTAKKKKPKKEAKK